MNDDLIVVRDRRRRRFYVADNLIIDHYLPVIGDKGLTLYSLLCRLASDKLEMARPGYELLCEHTGWSRSTVWAYRQLLELVKLIEVVSGGGRRTNIYYLLDVQPLDAERITAITQAVATHYNNGFQKQVLQRLAGWRPLQSRFHDAPRRAVVVASQDGFQFHDETTPFHDETTPFHDETTPFHGETGSTMSDQESGIKNQEQEATTTREAVYVAVDVAAALTEAGILSSQHLKIVRSWLEKTGTNLTVAEITAWADYVQEVNEQRDRRKWLQPGFIVSQLLAGVGAPKRPAAEEEFFYLE